MFPDKNVIPCISTNVWYLLLHAICYKDSWSANGIYMTKHDYYISELNINLIWNIMKQFVIITHAMAYVGFCTTRK